MVDEKRNQQEEPKYELNISISIMLKMLLLQTDQIPSVCKQTRTHLHISPFLLD